MLVVILGWRVSEPRVKRVASERDKRVNQGDLACWENKPAQVLTYKSYQSLVRAVIEHQPPSADWLGKWLMQIILKGNTCTLSTQSAVTPFDGGVHS
jgi:hypothetical protein